MLGKAVWGKPLSSRPPPPVPRTWLGGSSLPPFPHFQRPFGRHPSRATQGVSRIGQDTASEGDRAPRPLIFHFRSFSYLYVWQNIALK